MSMYRKEWPCCGDVSETNAWEPETCPFCTPAASPQPPATHKGAWMPISTAPENMTKYVVVRWIDREGVEHHDFDYTEDGCWMKWHDHAEHVEMIGGHGVSYTPPYLHFLQLPEPPGIPKESA